MHLKSSKANNRVEGKVVSGLVGCHVWVTTHKNWHQCWVGSSVGLVVVVVVVGKLLAVVHWGVQGGPGLNGVDGTVWAA